MAVWQIDCQMFQLLKADTRENAIYILECQAGKYLFNIHYKNCVHGKRGIFLSLGFIIFSYVLWIRMWIFYIFFAQGSKPTWWTPLIYSHLPAKIPGQVFYYFILNRDTQIPNEKTNWFWHLWPYSNLEVGLADLRSSMHKWHPKTKYLHRRLEKTDALALGDSSNFGKDVFAALPLYCRGKQWDCELFL